MEYNVFTKRLDENRCLKNNFALLSGEHIVSEKSFPDLYSHQYNSSENDFIKNIFSFIHKNNRDILQLDSRFLKKIQSFFNMIIFTSDDYIKEKEIHLYIFLFWENIIWEKDILPNLNKEKLFYEGQTHNSQDKFQSNLLPYITNNCDLIYHDIDTHTIDLIEIKNVDLDDRAISQIQRYYRNTNIVCETYDHKLNILNLKPTLIINHKNISYRKNQTTLLHYWNTFPTYFRELLEIYTFEYCKINETLKIIDLKPKLKSLMRN